MSEKIKFIMILHNHQPVGNFDWVFRDAAQDSYIPFLDVLENHPEIRLGLHTTGPLLEWFEEERPDYLDRVGKLVTENRGELLGGAFYEPILSILPDRDKNGQLEMMNNWLLKRFHHQPTGCWMAERIWEPGLASILGNNQLSWTTLDNTHFQAAGIPDDMIWGSYVTDDQGIPVRVLPIDYHLRYLIPFREPQETIDYIGSLKERGVTAVTYADDGEKFGVWPGTKQWVFGEGWLERFLTALEENSDWIDFTLPGNYVSQTPPLGKVYLPTASYKEMMEWALPVEAQKRIETGLERVEGDERFESLKPFIRGGFWRNFLVKYPESDSMYRRMLLVSNAVEKARADKHYHTAARELYMAQCNCGWWHGVFGGLYLNFLRRAIYQHLIRAERLISEPSLAVTVADVDGDGFEEVIMENDSLKLFCSLRAGGSVYEFDYFPVSFNLFDTFTRREESYHRKIDVSESTSDEHASIHDTIKSKDKDILDYLIYDWYRRASFIDHFISPDESRDDFVAVRYDELGDFIIEPYSILKETNRNGRTVLLIRDGMIRKDSREVPVRVGKRFSVPHSGASIIAGYEVDITGNYDEDVYFGVEMNFGFQSGHADDSFIEIPGRTLVKRHLASSGDEKEVSEVSFTVGWMPLKVTLFFSIPARLWWFPVETVSLSEGGVERNYQNTCVVPLWRITPDKGAVNLEIEMVVES